MTWESITSIISKMFMTSYGDKSCFILSKWIFTDKWRNENFNQIFYVLIFVTTVCNSSSDYFFENRTSSLGDQWFNCLLSNGPLHLRTETELVFETLCVCVFFLSLKFNTKDNAVNTISGCMKSYLNISGISCVQSAGWLDVQFTVWTVWTSCERAAPLAE
jgi:hypothetical protein